MKSTTSNSGRPRIKVVRVATGHTNARCLLNSAALNASASTMPPTRDARASPRVIQAASNNRLNMAYCAKYLS